ncbi:spore gernimation protein [Xylanibacillus composti]|uniref:Germination protein GerD n=1 Tax=Xylanibacillus composti TaxID=1572762 RepID=A0A8J4H7F4_9BACL|nr:spore germination lipoprotein GerD [Xylanibacillus composti]MDT9727012.1 spore gernimation protein [Xylanibacillus composti]GIQ71230.1 germination protein GerD [Xylanibacillus composti]
MNQHSAWRKLGPCITCLLLIIALLSGCGTDQQGGTMDYKEVKSMVVDILKTEEGKKAIQEVQQEEEQKNTQGQSEMKIMQMLKSEDGQQIQMAVKEVLTDPSYPKVLEQMMTDPKFAGEFAKAVQKENEKLHKDLMKDPEYQTMLLEVMNNQEYKDLMLDVLKGKEYRQQTMTVMQEALENPLFRLELMELMKKVMEEESKPKKEQSGGGESGGGGGGESGGGGGGGAGGS